MPVTLATCGLLAALAPVLTAAATAPQTETKPQAVVAEPSAIVPGQTVTLRWYFTGKKVTVSGGRFGTGTVVTGRTKITDKPVKTTHYTFNVDYVGQKTNAVTGKGEMKPLHATYTVVAEVAASVAANLSLFRDRYGWQISVLKGWKRDNVDMPDPANNALAFFQPEDDSVERVAVSVLPADRMTAADLMGRVQKSLSTNYEQIQVVSDQEVTFADAPAVLSTFTGIDQSHPGTRTQSMLLAFVKNGRAYVLSARTAANQFKARQPLLEKMIKSFTLRTSTASSN